MATVMLGGLISATLVSLLVLPALYARFARDYDPADDLLHDLHDIIERPAAPQPAGSWLDVDPDSTGDRRRPAVGIEGAPTDRPEGSS
jgi:hypothetical protein